MSKLLATQTTYTLLTLLADTPRLSQRQLAKRLGVSVGKAHYCLRGLIDKGLIRPVRRNGQNNRPAWHYHLTEAGETEKQCMARRTLKEKIAQHAALGQEIEQLQKEVDA